MLPIIVAGSRPATAPLAQRRHFACDTSVDPPRWLHLNITETGRSPPSSSSTVRLNPIGSHRPNHAQQPNRHRARRNASVSFPRFPPLEVFERRPQAAEIVAPSVIGRHPKTFTQAEVERPQSPSFPLGQRLSDTTRVLDEKLCDRTERAVLEADDSDGHGRKAQFDRQDLELWSCGRKS
jgi:hypothetical protein